MKKKMLLIEYFTGYSNTLEVHFDVSRSMGYMCGTHGQQLGILHNACMSTKFSSVIDVIAYVTEYSHSMEVYFDVSSSMGYLCGTQQTTGGSTLSPTTGGSTPCPHV